MLTHATVSRLETVLDAFCNSKELVTDVLNPKWDISGWSFYDKLINQRQRLAFRAICCYAINNGSIADTEGFRDWMRLIWNSIADPNLRTIRAMIGAFLFIEDMLPYSSNIVSYLAVCKYDNDNVYYLFHLNDDLEVVADDCFDSIEQCKKLAGSRALIWHENK